MDNNINDNVIDLGDLTQVSSKLPLVKEGVYDVRIAEMKVEDNKAKDGKILKVKLTLETNAESTEGETISMGYPLFDNISLKMTEKYDPRKRLREIMDATKLVEAQFLPEKFIGQVCCVNVKVEIDPTGQYDPQNRIRRYVAKK